MSGDTRLKLGVALLILGLLMPVGTLLVAVTDWPITVKMVATSILLFGFAIMLVPAAGALFPRARVQHCDRPIHADDPGAAGAYV
jgi:hypothetical protein